MMKLFEKLSLLTVLFTLVVIFSFSRVQAQVQDTTQTKMDAMPYTLKGKVIDNKTTKAVGNATVVLSGVDDSTTTDNRGMFEFTELAPGNHQIQIKADGYLPWQKEVIIGKETEPLMVKLKPAE